jgi:hypothetical protein
MMPDPAPPASRQQAGEIGQNANAARRGRA